MDSGLTRYTFYRGRVALYAILRAMNIGAGDEVATQAFTCVAVPEGIMACGARPIYVDIESSGFNMDAYDLANKLTVRTRAIVVQHTYGIPADLDRICDVARTRGIPIIEDCCHTLLSRYNGRTVGGAGAASFFSFEWGKPIVAGIGGSAVINETALKEQVDHLYGGYRYPRRTSLFRTQLQYYAFKVLYRPCLYWPVRSLFHWLGSLGVAESNYNPVGKGNIAEDFGLRMALPLQRRLKRKLTRLDQQTRHSRWVANEYMLRIRSANVTHPVFSEKSDPVFARYPLITNDKPAMLRKARAANVELAEWYASPVHPLTNHDLHLVAYQPGSCPNAEKRCSHVVTLPTHPAVGEKDLDLTIRFLNDDQG